MLKPWTCQVAEQMKPMFFWDSNRIGGCDEDPKTTDQPIQQFYSPLDWRFAPFPNRNCTTTCHQPSPTWPMGETCSNLCICPCFGQAKVPKKNIWVPYGSLMVPTSWVWVKSLGSRWFQHGQGGCRGHCGELPYAEPKATRIRTGSADIYLEREGESSWEGILFSFTKVKTKPTMMIELIYPLLR